MAYVVAVTWTAKEGEEERVSQLLDEITPLVRAEPGCQLYIASRAEDDARTFFLYEQYDDIEAFQAHRESEHFQRLVLDEAVPLLESRIHSNYTTID